MKFCNQCGSNNLQASEKTFSNGTKHLKLMCRDCGGFNGFMKQPGRRDILVAKDHTLSSSVDVEVLVEKARGQIQSFMEQKQAGKTVTLIMKVK